MADKGEIWKPAAKMGVKRSGVKSEEKMLRIKWDKIRKNVKNKVGQNKKNVKNKVGQNKKKC